MGVEAHRPDEAAAFRGLPDLPGEDAANAARLADRENELALARIRFDQEVHAEGPGRDEDPDVTARGLAELEDAPVARVIPDSRYPAGSGNGNVAVATPGPGPAEGAWCDLGPELHWWAHQSVRLDPSGARDLAAALTAWADREDPGRITGDGWDKAETQRVVELLGRRPKPAPPEDDLHGAKLAGLALLVAHQQRIAGPCACGWDFPGASHVRHQLEVLEAAGLRIVEADR